MSIGAAILIALIVNFSLGIVAVVMIRNLNKAFDEHSTNYLFDGTDNDDA